MRILVIALALLTSAKSFSYSTTNLSAYTLAETVYVTALTGATTELSTNAASSSNQRLEAIKLQNDIQNYFQSGIASPFLENKMSMAAKVLPELSNGELIDALLESTEIILRN